MDPAQDTDVSESAQTIEGLVFTDAAARKVGELIREEGNPKLKLRVFVSGGGCSGFQYGFQFDEKRDDDNLLEVGGIQVVVDPQSATYLRESKVDYVEDFRGAGFSVTNPQSTGGCGCGKSFSA